MQALTIMSFERLNGKLGYRTDIDGNGERGRMSAAMGNADLDSLDADSVGLLASRSPQANDRTPSFLILYFHVEPTNAVSPAGPERFQNRFLSREATGKSLDGRSMRLAISNLACSENALKELLAVPFDHASDANAFNNVRPDIDDVHRYSWFPATTERPCSRYCGENGQPPQTGIC
jgi:hypothetical protein